LRYRDGRLELLDQRRLPGECVFIHCPSAAAVAECIRTLAVRGAPAIGCAAAYGVAVEAARLAAGPASAFAAGLGQGIQLLHDSRPTAVNLFWALERMKCAWAAGPAAPKACAAALLAEAEGIRRADIAVNRRMGELGAALLPARATVLTHCNAGALATAGYGTALGVLRAARAAGKEIAVYADETRPLLQGARLTAYELLADGFPVTLLPDSAAGLLLSRGGIDAVIVGADRVAANGDAANKIGTYPLAVLAARHGVPFYVVCPVSTLDPTTASGAQIVIEERGEDEVFGFGALRWAANGARAFNPAFDVTPAALITALVTERGVLRSVTEIGIAALLATPAPRP
jgi:methylthioribose-1-phosphate isomerase